MAVVEGRLQIRPWTDKEGNNRRSAEVIVDNMYFGDSKRDGDTGGARPASGPVNVSANDWQESDENEGDLPF